MMNHQKNTKTISKKSPKQYQKQIIVKSILLCINKFCWSNNQGLQQPMIRLIRLLRLISFDYFVT